MYGNSYDQVTLKKWPYSNLTEPINVKWALKDQDLVASSNPDPERSSSPDPRPGMTWNIISSIYRKTAHLDLHGQLALLDLTLTSSRDSVRVMGLHGSTLKQTIK